MSVKLKDSHVFKNVITADAINKLLAKIDFSKAITKEDLVSELAIIEKRVTKATKFKILDLYYQNKFVLVKDSNVKLPSYLTTLPFKSKGETKVLIDLSRYGTGKNVVSNVNTLYGLLQNALVAYYLEENFDRFKNNVGLLTYGSLAYSKLIMKVLNKLYSVNLDKVESDFLAFVFAKFFLISMAGRADVPQTDDIAYKAVMFDTSFNLIKEKEAMFNVEHLYDNIFDLFTTLNSQPRHNIKFRTFFENYARMYGEGTVLAIDYLPAFYSMLFSAEATAGINKDFIILDVVTPVVITKTLSNFVRLL